MKKLKELKNKVSAIEEMIENLKKKKSENAISEEAKTKVDAQIAKLQEVVTAINDAVAAAEEGTDDKTAELESKVAEILKRIKEIETNKIDPQPTNVEDKIKNIINSKKMVNKFFDVVKNTKEPKDFQENWAAAVKAELKKNNIDDDNIADFLPGFIVNEINDNFVGKRHRILELVDWTGLPTFKALYETGGDMALVHERGTEKTEQELEFSKTEIRPDLVYKYICIDKKVEKESMDAGRGNVLITYITKELVDRLLATIENFILVGTSPFKKAQEVELDATLGSEQYNALAYMNDVDGSIAVMGKAKYLAIKNSLTTSYNMPATHDDVLAALNVDEIIFNESTFTPSTEDATWEGIWYMRPSDYKMVGDRQPEKYNAFNLAYNQNQYLIEMFVGGGCVVPNNFIALITVSE